MATTALPSIENTITGTVSADRLMADTAAIAQWVRLSGSDDEAKAFEYIAGVLRSLGIEPVLYCAPAYISVPDSAELRVNGKSVQAITHSMATSTGPSGLRLPIEYVGDGSPLSYAGRDVRGKIVMIDGMAMPGKVQAAERAEAAACVFANHDESVHEMIVSTVWGSPTPDGWAKLPRIPAVTVGGQDATILRADLHDGRNGEAFLITQVTTKWMDIPTLVATVEGADEPEKFVLFSGHVDSWHYGAMDNGTANATMLETLRVVLPHRKAFRRSLRLAFWSGHSHGRYAGSAWYADNFWEDLHHNAVLHLNVDSVGGQNASVLTEAHTMPEVQPVAADVIRALTGIEFTGTRFGRAGDQSFQSHGIPSLFMSLSEQPPAEGDSAKAFAELVGGEGAKSGGLGWWWHTPDDTIDKIDPSLLVRDAQIYAAITYRFLNEPILPLDLLASANDLLMHLQTWQRKAGDSFDLRPALARAEEVRDLAATLQSSIASEGGAIANIAPAVNSTIVEADRALVRLSYVESDLFTPDPARSQPPVPLLSPITDLMQNSPGSAEFFSLQTLLVRRRNRLLHELNEARQALKGGIHLVGGS